MYIIDRRDFVDTWSKCTQEERKAASKREIKPRRIQKAKEIEVISRISEYIEVKEKQNGGMSWEKLVLLEKIFFLPTWTSAKE